MEIIDLLAANLRRLRRLRGLSSAELARRAGVGPATLSLLERSQGNPTLETVTSLAAALGVPVTDLIDGARRPPVTVVRADQGARVTRPNLDLRFVHRFSSSGLDTVEFYEMTVLPGQEYRSRGHAGVENIVVTSGTLVAGPVDQPVTLSAGDFVAFSADAPHVYSTSGDVPAKAVLALRHAQGDLGPEPVSGSVILSLADEVPDADWQEEQP
ncbi:helix-turn-helix domain-containing protein [Nonomuraea sp. NPDC050790]|uniref:helix-turn-helix domain-containing protein n=1 Tax=Nonomuraea sp. NPDC050790 TaxID=3364371 RepID=UPI0037A41E1F